MDTDILEGVKEHPCVIKKENVGSLERKKMGNRRIGFVER